MPRKNPDTGARRRKSEVTTEGYGGKFLSAAEKKQWHEDGTPFDIVGCTINSGGSFGRRVVYTAVDSNGEVWLLSFGLVNPDGSGIDLREREASEFMRFFAENEDGVVGPMVLTKRGRAWVMADVPAEQGTLDAG
jgi:hypothetical protein